MGQQVLYQLSPQLSRELRLQAFTITPPAPTMYSVLEIGTRWVSYIPNPTASHGILNQKNLNYEMLLDGFLVLHPDLGKDQLKGWHYGHSPGALEYTFELELSRMWTSKLLP